MPSSARLHPAQDQTRVRTTTRAQCNAAVKRRSHRDVIVFCGALESQKQNWTRTAAKECAGRVAEQQHGQRMQITRKLHQACPRFRPPLPYVSSLGPRVWDLGSRVSGLGSRVSGEGGDRRGVAIEIIGEGSRAEGGSFSAQNLRGVEGRTRQLPPHHGSVERGREGEV
eukprot:1778677-Rhodomonas_salina.1